MSNVLVGLLMMPDLLLFIAKVIKEVYTEEFTASNCSFYSKKAKSTDELPPHKNILPSRPLLKFSFFEFLPFQRNYEFFPALLNT
jgi:hypothetical protein